MIVKYFEKTNEIILFGTGSEINFFSEQLLLDKAKVDLEVLSPLPDFKFLEFIQIERIPDKSVKIIVNDNYLLIGGSLEKLSIFSANLEGNFGLKNYHIHFEYYDGHFFLSPKSKALIVEFI